VGLAAAIRLDRNQQHGGHRTRRTATRGWPIHWAIRRYVSETNGRWPERHAGVQQRQRHLWRWHGRTHFVDGVGGLSEAGVVSERGTPLWCRLFRVENRFRDSTRCGDNEFLRRHHLHGDDSTAGDAVPVGRHPWADWSPTGTQGKKGWFYGFFSKTNTSVTYTDGRFVRSECCWTSQRRQFLERRILALVLW